jgi:hypothetical protein
MAEGNAVGAAQPSGGMARHCVTLPPALELGDRGSWLIPQSRSTYGMNTLIRRLDC